MTATEFNAKTALCHEWIGKRTSALCGRKKTIGEIVDETKQTFTIETENGVEKKIVKREAVFEVESKSGRLRVRGSALFGRSADRLKNASRRGNKK